MVSGVAFWEFTRPKHRGLIPVIRTFFVAALRRSSSRTVCEIENSRSPDDRTVILLCHRSLDGFPNFFWTKLEHSYRELVTVLYLVNKGAQDKIPRRPQLKENYDLR